MLLTLSSELKQQINFLTKLLINCLNCPRLKHLSGDGAMKKTHLIANIVIFIIIILGIFPGCGGKQSKISAGDSQ